MFWVMASQEELFLFYSQKRRRNYKEKSAPMLTMRHELAIPIHPAVNMNMQILVIVHQTVVKALPPKIANVTVAAELMSFHLFMES